MGLYPWLAIFLSVHTPLGVCFSLQRAPRTSELKGIHGLMDADGSGSVSLDEGLAYVSSVRSKISTTDSLAILDNMDTNKDNQLSLGEFRADLKLFDKMDDDERESLEGMFSLFDQDADELLNPSEASMLFSWMFRSSKKDANGDNMISKKEFRKAAEEKLRAARASSVAFDESRVQGRYIFKKLDVDGDGQLSPIEYFRFESGVFAGEEALQKLFEIADADGNQLLTLDELNEARAKKEFGGSSAYHHLWSWIEDEGLKEKDEEL